MYFNDIPSTGPKEMLVSSIPVQQHNGSNNHNKEEMREIITRQTLKCHDSEMTWEKLPWLHLGMIVQ